MSSKVNKALIMAGSSGTRLGMGTKSHILYKDRLLLEYVLDSVNLAGIKDLVVFLPNKDIEDTLSKEKITRLRYLKESNSNIRWVQFPKELGLGFRGALDLVKDHFGSEPFYLLCGHSPQSSSFLKRMGDTYTDNSIVLSGYRYRYESCVSIGKVESNKVIDFNNIAAAEPRDFRATENEYITQMPYIIDFKFYEDTIKKDLFKNKIEFYPKEFIKEGGTCYLLENPVQISEVDYMKDFKLLLESIDALVSNNYKL
ncbi:MAG: hypothetical protein ACD_24C00313G0002 [uncultured bacterium]|uniref:Uncharacterized protein n=1 Tax=candidate division WWE3 bacterium TaxID=2053526 RepID=A0A656PM67_UNCKA|nr:hypothetical protein P147_WWE3C00001G0824 [candidate division WWE3 bacterium RAAC2_WWE3_1]EKD95832.1 MAG: hypothetical protein ACD_24C00313G0002 [uncultured bacterium]KKS28949.1 MAG: hypothetical protein UU91_C0011G0003 [candidate division WWE3 bacterium GW2011_GWB1_42_117]KKS54494.1 MAG: hypothetical protein UV21_C0007G0003 [candidate division WWE3 bacterium GW2011_GWD2_42_34]KKT05450.1 MAG: hypothetical protein UV83_C0003G0005 [candidate division WWE3 bacterium GW2011_GWE2_43_18]KKT06797.